MEGKSSSLAEKDAKQLELSYKTLWDLQRKTLSFLTSLSEYEKKYNNNRDPIKSSRMAFIVTPLMVNHYNHMHHVYRASMYGKVPDLCDQTGGIMCTDLGTLREELAKTTTDVNRSLTSTFRTATLPNVEFNFKTVRDNVVETTIRMLDAIDIKQPDLTHSIRDDYIQNVRAIQEALTNALEKSKERSTQLQSRLDDALRKLEYAETALAVGVPSPNSDLEEDLRKELFKSKETIVEQQRQLSTQSVEIDLNILKLREAEGERDLLRETMKRVNDQARNGAEGLAALRTEIFTYASKELAKLQAEYASIRNDLSARVQDILSQSYKEKQETINMCRTLLDPIQRGSGSDGDVEHNINTRFFQLQQDYNRLRKENDDLKQQNSELHQDFDKLQNEMPITPNDKQLTSIATPIMFTDEISRDSNIMAEGSQHGMDYESSISSVMADTNSELEHRYHSLLNSFRSKEQQQKEMHLAMKTDLGSIYNFFTDPDNIEAALQLAAYVYKHNIVYYSEYANLLKYLGSIHTDERIQMYMKDKTMEIIESSGLMNEIAVSRLGIESLNKTVVYSDHVIGELVAAIEVTYNNIKDVLRLENLPSEVVTPQGLKKYFENRFGDNLKNRIFHLVEELANYNERIIRLQRDEKMQEQSRHLDSHLVAFDADPTLFEELLHNIWSRHDSDRLKRLLNSAYYALALDRVNRYETSTANVDLKLYNVVEYTVLTNLIKRHAKDRDVLRPEFVNPRLNEEEYFLKYFISQLGNVQVENYINKLSLCARNKLATILFSEYYIPIVNKKAFVMSIEGPFANFHMVYKV